MTKVTTLTGHTMRLEDAKNHGMGDVSFFVRACCEVLMLLLLLQLLIVLMMLLHWDMNQSETHEKIKQLVRASIIVCNTLWI